MVDEVAKKAWVVCDAKDVHFREVVPEGIVEDEAFIMEYATYGVTEYKHETRFIEQVGATKVDDVVAQWKGSGEDCRILPVYRGNGGKRAPSLRDLSDLT